MDSNPNPLTDGQTKHAITCQGEAFLLLRTGGTDTEIGRAIGEATAGDIGEMWEQFTAPRLVPQYGTPLERVGETCAWLRRNLEQICPWMAEQIDGIAEGSGLAREQVWIMNHYGVLWSAHGLFCTSLAVAESDHGPLLAQNLDIGAEDFYFVSCTRPTGGYAVLSDRMCAMCWSPTGINERGLAVGSSNLPRHGADVEKPLPPGVANHFIPHMVLRSCANVSEAVDCLRSMPPVTPPSSGYQLNLLDADGGMAVVDKCGPKTLVRQCEPGMIYTTNCSLEAEFEGWRTTGAKPGQDGSARARAARIRAAYAARHNSTPSVAWLRALFRSHDGPGRLCRHGDDASAGGYSRLHFVYFPQERSAEITNGLPCRNEPQRFALSP